MYFLVFLFPEIMISETINLEGDILLDMFVLKLLSIFCENTFSKIRQKENKIKSLEIKTFTYSKINFLIHLYV